MKLKPASKVFIKRLIEKVDAEERQMVEARLSLHQQAHLSRRRAIKAKHLADEAERAAKGAERAAWLASLPPHKRREEKRLNLLAKQYEESDIKPI